MAQLVADDRTRGVRTVTPANGRKFTLEEMQALVGGLVQMIGLSNGQILMFNEEGKYAEGFELNDARDKPRARRGDYAVGLHSGPGRARDRAREAGFNEDEEDDEDV